MSSNNNSKDKPVPQNRIDYEDADEEKKSLLKVEATKSLDFNHRNSNDDDNEIVVEVTKATLALPSKNQKSMAK